MKTFFTICCLSLISMNAFSHDQYTEPTKLTPVEEQATRTALINNKIALLNHWKARTEMAKRNNNRLAKSGAPLQRPYYGDSGLSQHHH